MSENIIGLLFEIAGDPTKGEKAMAKLNASSVAESAEISSIWSEAMGAMTGPIGIAVGGFTALGGAMFEVASKAAEAGAKVYEASEKTRMSTESLSGVMALAKETGGSFDSLIAAFTRATVNLAKAADTGKGALAELFSQAELQSLKLKPVEEKMQIVIQRIFDLNDVGERNRALQALMGRGWQENITVLKLLAEQGYAPAVARAKELGLYYDEDAARRAREFTLQVAHMKATWEGFSNSIGQYILPEVSSLFGLVFGTGEEWRIWSDNATALIEIPFQKLMEWIGKIPGFGAGFRESAAAMQRDIDNLETDAALTQQKIEAGFQQFLPKARDIGDQINDALDHGNKPKGSGGASGGPLPKFLTYGPTMKQLIPTIDGMTKATDGAVSSLTLWELQQQKETYQILPLMQQNLAGLGPVFEQNIQLTQAHTSALQTFGKAMESDVAAQAAQGAIGLAGLVAGRKAQAGVEAVWETARGIALLAEGTWPPNPAAILAAGMHFEAAAQYAIIAGSSAHHRGAAGAGSSYGSVSHPSDSASRGPDSATSSVGGPLASGAAASGRFGSPGTGIVVVHGSQDFHQFIAQAVTDATNRGYSVVSTQSQRGAPVGH